MAFSRTDPPSTPLGGPAPGQNNLSIYDLYIRISRPTHGWESEWEKCVTRDGTSPAMNMLNKALMSHISTTKATALRFIQSDHDMIRNSKITALGANDSATGAGIKSSHDPKLIYLYFPRANDSNDGHPASNVYGEYGLPYAGPRVFGGGGMDQFFGMQWYQKIDVRNETEITPWVQGSKKALFVRMEYCCAIAVLSDTKTSDVTWTQTLWRDYLTNSFVFLDVGHKTSSLNEGVKNMLHEIAAFNRGPRNAKFVPTVMNLEGNTLPLALVSPFEYASEKGYEILTNMQNTIPKNVYTGQDFLAMMYVLLHRTYFCPKHLGTALLKRFKDIGGLEPNLVSGQKVHLVYYPPSNETEDYAPSRGTRGHSWGLGQAGNDVLTFTNITRNRSHQIYPCVIEFSSASSGSITTSERCTFKTTDGDKPLVFDGVKLEGVTLRSYVGGNTTSLESGFPVNLVLDPPVGSGVSVSTYAASTRDSIGGLRPAWIKQADKADLGTELMCNWAIFRVDIGNVVNMKPKETPAPSALTGAPLRDSEKITYPPVHTPSDPQPTDPPTPSASAPQPTDPQTPSASPQADTTLLAGFTEKLGVARLFGVSNDVAEKIVLCSAVAIFLIVAAAIIYGARKMRTSGEINEPMPGQFDALDRMEA
jgi:hypothetical protein